MRIISLNVGLPSAQRYESGSHYWWHQEAGAQCRAALWELRRRPAGRSSQPRGLEKAVCVYPFDHYPYWSRQLGRDLRPGAFSENLTVSGAIETEVCVGDVFRIGEASVRVSQPRMRAPSLRPRTP